MKNKGDEEPLKRISVDLQRHWEQEFVWFRDKEHSEDYDVPDLSQEFLTEDPSSTWAHNTAYIAAAEIAKSLAVTNNTVERGRMALIREYNGLLSKTEEQKFITQVVGEHRKLFPDACCWGTGRTTAVNNEHLPHQTLLRCYTVTVSLRVAVAARLWLRCHCRSYIDSLSTNSPCWGMQRVFVTMPQLHGSFVLLGGGLSYAQLPTANWVWYVPFYTFVTLKLTELVLRHVNE